MPGQMGMLLQIIGLIVGVVVFIEASMMLFTAFRQHRGTVRLLSQQMEDARAIADAYRLEYERARAKSELSWEGYRKFKIEQKICENESESVCSFYLTPHDNRPLPPFEPGQFLTFQLHMQLPAGQLGRKSTIRCYSLSSCANPKRYRVSIKRVPSGLASNYFHDHLNVDDILDVKAPSGHFFLDKTQNAPVVLVGGGIGATPLLSMLEDIIENDVKRETWFFYGVRDSSEHIMKERLEQIARENDNIHLHVCYSSPKKDDVEGEDYHYAQRINVDLFKRLLPSSNYQFYVCGPSPMMTSIIEGLKQWGVPDADIKYEAFGADSIKKTILTEAVKVTFDKIGQTYDWDTSAASLLTFAEMNGVTIDSGCRVGNCRECLVAIKSGKVSYFREPDAPLEAGSCLTCISVPNSDLTLDA